MSNRIIVVGKFLVDAETGEIVEPVYTVGKITPTSKEDRKFYRDTSVSPLECTDPEQLKDFMRANCDMRGIRVKSELTWLKKENDYNVLTLGAKSMLTKTQYEGLKKLVKLVVYKNIIICTREEMCKALGVSNKHLSEKLALLEPYIKQMKAKKGFVKVVVQPLIAFKGRWGFDEALQHFYYTPKDD